MITKLFYIHAVQRGSTVIGGLRSMDFGGGHKILAERSGSAVTPELVAMAGQSPELGFGTVDLKAALDQFGTRGVKIAGNPLRFWLARAEDGAEYAANGFYWLMSAGIVYPTTLSASHGVDQIQAAEISFAVRPVSTDGSNAPVADLAEEALPSVSNAKQYALGEVELAGVNFTEQAQVQVNFGIAPHVRKDPAEVYPTLAHRQAVTPTLTFEGLDPSLVAAAGLPMVGKKGVHADTSVKLYEIEDGGTLGTAFIRLAAAGLVYPSKPFAGRAGQPGTVGLTMQVQQVGTNAPIVYGTA